MDELAVGIDSGGTFTDAVALVDGVLRVAKVPSTPRDPAQSTLQAYGTVVGPDPGFRAGLRHGTTVPTNALLERNGARTALVTTAGFADVVEIARQRRPDLFDNSANRAAPLAPAGLRFEVPERIDRSGRVLTPLAESVAADVCAEVAGADVEAVAVCLLHAYANESHELRLVELLEGALAGTDVAVVRSSEVAAELREYERTSTTLLHAYLAPGTASYFRRLGTGDAAIGTVLVMRSAGGLGGVDTLARRPADTLLSGPAAGALAAAAVAATAGYADALGFDMGGTSTDVCLIQDGRPQLRSLTTVGGLPCLAPALAVHTVGAGGGSIAWVDSGGALAVGPRSAGADPGPACYGKGGTAPTVTDANVVLGRITDLVGGGFEVDATAAAEALAAVGPGAAAAVVSVVEATMERALREVSVQRGIDPSGCVIVAFGGAGALHAAALCRALGAPAVLVPPHAGVLSAVGLLAAPVRADRSLTRLSALADFDTSLLGPLVEAAAAEVAVLVGGRGVTTGTYLDCRYRGQSHELVVPVAVGDEAGVIAEKFHDAHDRHNGYRRDGADIEVVTLRAEAEAAAGVDVSEVLAAAAAALPSAAPDAVRDGSGVARLRRGDLPVGFELAGPAVIAEYDSTTWVPDDFTARVDGHANLVLEPR